MKLVKVLFHIFYFYETRRSNKKRQIDVAHEGLSICRIPDGLCQMQSLSKFVVGTLDLDGVSQIHRFWPVVYLATCSLLLARIVKTKPVSMLSNVYSNAQPHLWQDCWLDVPSLDFASSPPQTGQTTYRLSSFFLLLVERGMVDFELPIFDAFFLILFIPLHERESQCKGAW